MTQIKVVYNKGQCASEGVRECRQWSPGVNAVVSFVMVLGSWLQARDRVLDGSRYKLKHRKGDGARGHDSQQIDAHAAVEAFEALVGVDAVHGVAQTCNARGRHWLRLLPISFVRSAASEAPGRTVIAMDVGVTLIL